jgi:UDP-3-O-[3-hydroxymyristoyl] N-acetylglucosamine deacetylase
MPGSIRFEGRGLHTAAPCAVELRRSATAVGFVHRERLLSRAELEIVRSDRGVCIAHHGTGFELELVEHLFAALGGLSIQRGVSITVDGPEVPLLGGGALELGHGLLELSVPPSAPALIVERDDELVHEGSVYRFGVEDRVALEVQVDFPETGSEAAAWHGDAAAFVTEIAPARTFGFLREARLLWSSGRARHVDPRAVLLLDAEGHAAGSTAPRQPGELARHKLLDLIGDLYLYGGPPRGRLSATRPGHSATHAVVQKALDRGTLSRHAELDRP